MRKSDKVGAQFEQVMNLLNLAEGEFLAIRELEMVTKEAISKIFITLMEQVEDATYETCGPMQMEEDEKDAQIEMLKQKIAELEESMK